MSFFRNYLTGWDGKPAFQKKQFFCVSFCLTAVSWSTVFLGKNMKKLRKIRSCFSSGFSGRRNVRASILKMAHLWLRRGGWLFWCTYCTGERTTCQLHSYLAASDYFMNFLDVSLFEMFFWRRNVAMEWKIKSAIAVPRSETKP